MAGIDRHGVPVPPGNRELYLCAGLQSSGSTLVSWCFLQRQDMDGILDGRGDVLPAIPQNPAVPYTWCKFTITAFRLRDMIVRYEADGWRVHPVLVVRDVRSAFNSLVTKEYGCNGVTAEEPPLRLRFLRYKDDWRLARSEGWPIVRYESLVQEPEPVLRNACAQLGLRWDHGMLTWPKPATDIAFPCNGNATFQQTRGNTFHDSVRPNLATPVVNHIPAGDLAWLDREFADYNADFDYPPHVPSDDAAPDGILTPRYENTRRYRRFCRHMQRAQRRAWLGRLLPFLRVDADTVYLRSIGWR